MYSDAEETVTPRILPHGIPTPRDPIERETEDMFVIDPMESSGGFMPPPTQPEPLPGPEYQPPGATMQQPGEDPVIPHFGEATQPEGEKFTPEPAAPVGGMFASPTILVGLAAIGYLFIRK